MSTTTQFDGVAQCYLPPRELDLPADLRLHRDAGVDVDPVTYEVLRYSLMNINFEHCELIQKLCVSPVTMFSLDFQSSILMEDGDLLFLGPNLQYFSNSHAFTIKWVLEHRAAALGVQDGDMFLANDPYVGAPHQPDVCVAMPVFVGDEVFCWVANVMHHSDVGGPTPGSFCLGATDAWSDPPMIPPVKLVEGGRVRPDVEDLFLRQSRMPQAARMDLRAAVSGNEYARRRVLALVERYGADVVKSVMGRVMDAGEELFAERLRSIPDGRWSHRAYTEAATPGDRGVYCYQVNVTKRDDRLVVDNEGTDPQAGSINEPLVAFVGAVLCALTQQLTSDLAGAYGGVYRRVDFEPVPGLLNCPAHPAACSPSGAYQTEMNINAASHAIGRMLACGDEETRRRILGPVLPHAYGCIYAGMAADGRIFITVKSDVITGPAAGTEAGDGLDIGGQYWVPGAIAYNTEQVESSAPVLYLYRRLLSAGADGAGRHRGGRGFEEAAVPWGAVAFSLELYANESFTKGPGMFGGDPESRAWTTVKASTDVRRLLASGRVPQALAELEGTQPPVGFKSGSLPLDADAVFEVGTPSNAGYGDPLRRTLDDVRADLQAGVLDARTARRVYAVVLADDGAPDVDASQRERAARRAERLGGRVPRAWVGGSTARPVGDALGLRDGRFACLLCDEDLGPVDANFKEACAVTVVASDAIADEFASPDADLAAEVEFRAFHCPGCGTRLETELARVGDPVLHDLQLH